MTENEQLEMISIIKRTKAQAVKEFAERLKGEQLFCSGCVPWYDIQNKISWIEKELVGE